MKINDPWILQRDRLEKITNWIPGEWCSVHENSESFLESHYSDVVCIHSKKIKSALAHSEFYLDDPVQKLTRPERPRFIHINYRRFHNLTCDGILNPNPDDKESYIKRVRYAQKTHHKNNTDKSYLIELLWEPLIEYARMKRFALLWRINTCRYSERNPTEFRASKPKLTVTNKYRIDNLGLQKCNGHHSRINTVSSITAKRVIFEPKKGSVL